MKTSRNPNHRCFISTVAFGQYNKQTLVLKEPTLTSSLTKIEIVSIYANLVFLMSIRLLALHTGSKALKDKKYL